MRKQDDWLNTVLRKLRHFEYELRVVKEPGRHASMQDAAHAWAVQTLPLVDAQLAAQKDEYTQQHRQWFGTPAPGSEPLHPRAIPSHESKALFGLFGARLEEAFEAAFNTWLAAKVWAVDAGWPTVVGIAIATLIFCEAFGHMMSSHLIHRTDVPEESRERIARYFPAALVSWLLFFALTYVLRTASGRVAEVLTPYTSFIFAGLEVATLILIGLGFATNHLYRWSGRDTAEYSKILDLRTRIVALTKLAQPGAELAAETASSPSGITRVASIILIFVIAMASAGDLRAQSSPTVVPSNETSGYTWVDVSTSLGPNERAPSLNLHKQVLPAVMQKLGVQSWYFVQFASDAWSAAPVAQAHTRGDARSACAPPILSEAARLFSPSHEAEVQRAAAKCRSAQHEEFLEAQKAVGSSVDVLLDRNRSQSSRCTNLLDGIERMARTGSVLAATFITDGRESCGPHRKIAPPEHPITVVVLLVPSGADAKLSKPAGLLFQQRKADLLRAAPWITVIPWFELTEEFFAARNPSSLAQK
jgi:hypothetical protein